MRKLVICAIFGSACSSLLAQRAHEVPHASRDYVTIVRILTPVVRRQASGPIRLTRAVIRESGDWAFIRSGIKMVNPKLQGDGDAFAILRRQGSRWAIIEESVGSGDMQDVVRGWVHKHRLPKDLVPRI